MRIVSVNNVQYVVIVNVSDRDGAEADTAVRIDTEAINRVESGCVWRGAARNGQINILRRREICREISQRVAGREDVVSLAYSESLVGEGLQ